MNTVSRHIPWKISWMISHDILMADPLIPMKWLMDVGGLEGSSWIEFSEQEIGLSIPSAPVDRK